jgi:hypothetical protein
VNLLLSIASTIVPPPASDAFAACGAGIGFQHPIPVTTVVARTTGLDVTVDSGSSCSQLSPGSPSTWANLQTHSSVTAFDFEDLAISAIQAGGGVSSTPPPPAPAASPQLTASAASLSLLQRDADVDGGHSGAGELRCDHQHRLHDRNSEFPGATEPESIAEASGTFDRTLTYVDSTAASGGTYSYEVASIDPYGVARSPSNKTTPRLCVRGNIVSTIDLPDNNNDLITTLPMETPYSSNPALRHNLRLKTLLSHRHPYPLATLAKMPDIQINFLHCQERAPYTKT